MHKKEISEQELQILPLLQELDLMDCTLIHSVNGNILTEYDGEHIGRTQWDILKMYREVIHPLHAIKQNRFSSGVYSFWGSCCENKECDYRKHLLHELDALSITACEAEDALLLKELCEQARRKIESLIEQNIPIGEFCLLHGDLHNGNILIRDDRYALIDFEYMRLGPALLEWSFVLFWDLVVNIHPEARERIEKKIRSEIRELIRNRILSEYDVELIMELYLPLILGMSLYSALKGQYADCRIIIEGIRIFRRSEYTQIRKSF